MKINLAKWGNSVAIRIPKAILEELNIDSNNFENVSFNIDVEGESLILKKKQERTKFELLAEQSNGEKLNPKFIVGVPVGFVGAAESKECLRQFDIPSISTIGNKGGSNVAAAIINALLYMVVGR